MTSPARSSEGTGFTLLELVLVTMALAVLVATAVPNIQRGWDTLRADRTAFTVAQTLRTAHALAVTQSRQITWTWHADTHQVSFDIPSAGASTTPSPSGNESAPDRLARPRDVASDVPLTVQPTGSSTTATPDTVIFFPDGTSQPVTLLIGDPASPRYHITVNGTTSRVKVKPGRPAETPVS